MNELAFAREAVAALRTMAAPNWVDIGGLVVGLAQCGLIFYGLRQMQYGTTDRKAQHEETMAAHKETMAILTQQGEALPAQVDALRAIVAQTAPRP